MNPLTLIPLQSYSRDSEGLDVSGSSDADTSKDSIPGSDDKQPSSESDEVSSKASEQVASPNSERMVTERTPVQHDNLLPYSKEVCFYLYPRCDDSSLQLTVSSFFRQWTQCLIL